LDNPAIAIPILAGTLLALAAGINRFLNRGLRPKPALIVVLRSGETIRGTLIRRRRGQLELGMAELLEPGGKATTIDGNVFLDRANIRWVQRPQP